MTHEDVQLDVETEKRISEIRERESKATKGPWEAQEMTHYGEPGTGYARSMRIGDDWENEITGLLFDDAEFMAHARADIPFLLEQLALLRRVSGKGAQERPKIICLCGSTRFIEQFAIQTWELELQGHIVLGCTLLPSWYCPVRDHFAESLGVKDQRDNHHLQKINLADEVLVLNIGGYIGESTKREIEYATKAGKLINYLEPILATTQGTPEGAK